LPRSIAFGAVPHDGDVYEAMIAGEAVMILKMSGRMSPNFHDVGTGR